MIKFPGTIIHVNSEAELSVLVNYLVRRGYKWAGHNRKPRYINGLCVRVADDKTLFYGTMDNAYEGNTIVEFADYIRDRHKKIAIRVKNEDEYNSLMLFFESKGFTWASRHKPTECSYGKTAALYGETLVIYPDYTDKCLYRDSGMHGKEKKLLQYSLTEFFNLERYTPDVKIDVNPLLNRRAIAAIKQVMSHE